ncbi:zinc ribbon domain-containing protein [Cesiribacter andamanensis]|uniref:Putative zinc ribbon domain protein n=1 Tax=Cesiribacter andamanensis AMV16 TaxID=1279009 RepID=M7N2N8_9BACT|nr:C4-type zinc ribbon domain-containing protein [Cesiribacter andamanensis]EMR02938.1 Putative zinc ribbon domain protein [Cesiribacter andamanensis AMV16]
MENTTAQKLTALLELQAIDSALDDIKKIRGALPEEVSDLEDEIAQYETRISKFEGELKEIEESIETSRLGIKESEKLIKKYEEQQMNVRNNREYDAITKEIELQNLEMQVGEKRIREAYVRIERKQEEIEGVKTRLEERQKDLEGKRKELQQITSESEEDEQKLLQEREEAKQKIEERLLRGYERVRNNARNGLAVVMVKRDACGGCFNIVPPQRRSDIRERKKIIVCEHCGRILADVEDETEESKATRAKSRRTIA